MLNRREIVGAAVSTVAAPSLRAQANSALTLGVVGCGNRGMYVTGLFAKNEFVRVAALCDIYEDKLKAAGEKYSGAKQFKRAEELMASDVDAVLIATPIAFHPEHFEMAVKAKKHIYMEKAAAVDEAGCHKVKRVALTADKSKRISMGFQQRYGTEYRRAKALIDSGELGKIKMIRGAWLGGGPTYKQGHAESEEKIRNWFFYRELSGDIIIEQDCHNMDVINWFMGKTPVKVNGYGTQAIRKKGDIRDSLACTFQFDDGTVFSYSANQFGAPMSFSDVSETFMCEKGTVQTSRKGVWVWREGAKQAEEWPTKYDITLDAVNQFVDGARKGQIENAALWGADSTLMAIMARNAMDTGKEATWQQVMRKA